MKFASIENDNAASCGLVEGGTVANLCAVRGECGPDLKSADQA